MLILSHRMRVLIYATLLAILALMLFTRPTHAAWSVAPVEVHATSNYCPLVSVAPDGAFGALIVWQENTASGGLLRARRLLANGDVDPGWAAPVPVSTVAANRSALGSVGDGSGGAYIWWMQGTQLYLTRLLNDGAIAPGWPANGRAIGVLSNASSRPIACSDGSDGVYLGWLTNASVSPPWVVVRAVHFGPANSGKDGWPTGGRILGGTMELGETVAGFGLAAATDGGLWLSYASTAQLEDNVFTPGSARIARYDAAGLPASGWPAEGVTLAPFAGDLLVNTAQLGLAPALRLAAVAPDASGGAFALFSFPTNTGEYQLDVDTRLIRVDASGTAAAGWAPAGVPANLSALMFSEVAPTADLSLRLHANGQGDVYVGLPHFALHNGSGYSFQRYTSAGSALPGNLYTGIHGVESADRGDGGLLSASVETTGYPVIYGVEAGVRVAQTSGDGYPPPSQDPKYGLWYGDVGVAAIGDGGSIFAWSQVQESFGVFAVRLNPSGQVTGGPLFPPTIGPTSVSFIRGQGVRVIGGARHVTLTLHDLTGRTIARAEADGFLDWTVPGTASLRSGMYFARTQWDGNERTFKVVVVR